MSATAKTFLKSKDFSKTPLRGEKIKLFSRQRKFTTPFPQKLSILESLDIILFKLLESQIEIQVMGDEFEVEDEEGIKLDSTEIIGDALSRDEKMELRTSSSDPVKLYLKKMGSVALLTREGRGCHSQGD